MVDLELSPEDHDIAVQIGRRAERLMGARGKPRPAVHIAMDLAAVHLNGCPLRLRDLLDADDFNLLHDVQGISRHLDRQTGKLDGRFLPRLRARSRRPRPSHAAKPTPDTQPPSPSAWP